MSAKGGQVVVDEKGAPRALMPPADRRLPRGGFKADATVSTASSSMRRRVNG